MSPPKDKYENYRQAALSGGVNQDAVEREISNMKAEDAKLEARVCYRCGSKITKTLDPRQAGPTEIAGKWFKYRCTECPYFAERCEPVGEN